jgi:hypothetical protein
VSVRVCWAVAAIRGIVARWWRGCVGMRWFGFASIGFASMDHRVSLNWGAPVTSRCLLSGGGGPCWADKQGSPCDLPAVEVQVVAALPGAGRQVAATMVCGGRLPRS